jgi:hypothetical protein
VINHNPVCRARANLAKIVQGYLKYLAKVEEENEYEHFHITTLNEYTESELRVELKAEGLPTEALIVVRMLGSKSSWRKTVQGAYVASFQRYATGKLFQAVRERQRGLLERWRNLTRAEGEFEDMQLP